jgi:hypothetical protein
MEVCPNGKYEPCTEYMKLEFERCEQLPEKSPLDQHNLAAILKTFEPESEPEQKMTVVVPKMRKHTALNNTFKNRVGKTNRYSRKSISLNIGDDLLSSP